MKILLVNSLYEPWHRGGAEDIVRTIAEEFCSRLDEVFIITTDPKLSSGFIVDKKDNLTIYRVGSYNVSTFYNLHQKNAILRLIWHIIDLINLPLYWQIYKITKKIKPDLIWAHNLMGLSLLSTRIFRRFKYWLTIHDVQYFDPSGQMYWTIEPNFLYKVGRLIYSQIVKIILARPNLLISPSHWLLTFYKQKGLFVKFKHIQLTNPLPNNIKPKQDTKSNNATRQWLYVGQIEKHKGIMFLLQNWPKDNNFQLTILGSGQNFAELKNNIKQTNIKLLPWPGFDQLNSFFQKADILIMPTLVYENNPFVINYSLTVGVPILASNIGGIPELINEGVNGWLFEPGDKYDLTDKLKKINSSDWSRLKVTRLAPNIKDYLAELLSY